MYEKAMKLMAQGKDVLHLEVGRPNFDTPLHIKEATKRALDDGIVHYGEFPGGLKLREAISDKVNSYNKIGASPDEILVTNGLTHAAYAVFMAALDEGDEVILLEPYYPQHINKIELAGGGRCRRCTIFSTGRAKARFEIPARLGCGTGECELCQESPNAV